MSKNSNLSDQIFTHAAKNNSQTENGNYFSFTTTSFSQINTDTNTTNTICNDQEAEAQLDHKELNEDLDESYYRLTGKIRPRRVASLYSSAGDVNFV